MHRNLEGAVVRALVVLEAAGPAHVLDDVLLLARHLPNAHLRATEQY